MKGRWFFVGAFSALTTLVSLDGCATIANAADFFDLAANGTSRDVQSAISRGADVHAREERGFTPLLVAAKDNEDPGVISVLLKAGADIEAVPDGGDYKWTALMWAAQSNANPEVITALLTAGANDRVVDQDGFTPLLMAAEYNGNPEVITRLLKAGEDVDQKDHYGWTPLMEAASRNHSPGVVMALLEAGADAKARNNAGYAALDYGLYNHFLEGTEALERLETGSE